MDLVKYTNLYIKTTRIRGRSRERRGKKSNDTKQTLCRCLSCSEGRIWSTNFSLGPRFSAIKLKTDQILVLPLI